MTWHPAFPAVTAELASNSVQPSFPPQPRSPTLDIPGLTKSNISPNGHIAESDVGAKLVIVMVGLPARGKSYISKKLARYLNWLQYNTRVFNAGERRRVASNEERAQSLLSMVSDTRIDQPELKEPSQSLSPSKNDTRNGVTKHRADFFDPNNREAVQLRETIALDTLGELLDWLLYQGGSVGILDATNNTVERRLLILDHIRATAGAHLGVLFLESYCTDSQLLEKNVQLKLSGPDYQGKDRGKALADFRQRIANYSTSYVPLGVYEEAHNIPYVSMIDVGRKVVAHQIHGFLCPQAVEYLFSYKLSDRQIWITRNGESSDDSVGRIGRNSTLSEKGVVYARTLTRFIKHQRNAWEQQRRTSTTNQRRPSTNSRCSAVKICVPSQPDAGEAPTSPLNFCVWTSMMSQAVQTAQFFSDEDFARKQMKMLDDLHAGKMAGLTFGEIRALYPDEAAGRKQDSLHYRWPGLGGEAYVDVIHRLRTVILELERMADHVLLITHAAVARVLLAYFQIMERADLADLDVPLHTLWALEPKPYGVDIKAYRYNPATEWFDGIPGYKIGRKPF